MLSAVLVLGLTFFSASPQAHRWLHGHAHHACSDHAELPAAPTADHHHCAITLFAHGVQVDAAPSALVPPRIVLQVLARIASTEFDLVAPRYLHQPERGPPSSRVG